MKRISKILNKICYSLIIIVTAMAAVILMARILLHSHLAATVERTTLVTEISAGHGTTVKDINAQLNFISKIQEGHIAPSRLMENLMNAVSEDIQFSTIRINIDNQTMELGGYARTRNSLLTLKNNMEASDFFSDIEFPIANILQKEDINFNISTKLNIYEDKGL